MGELTTQPRRADTVPNLLAKIAKAVSEGGGSGAATWDELEGKPTEFPPEAHTHVASELSDASAAGRTLLTAETSALQRIALGTPGVPGFELIEHWLSRADGGTKYWPHWLMPFASNGGGAAPNPSGGDGNHPGLMQLQLASTSSSWAACYTSTTALQFGSRAMLWESCQRIVTLSDATDTFTEVIGFVDGGGSVTVVDGAFFRYSHATNGGKWQAVTSNNSVQSTADTGVTVVANTWYRLRVEVNAAGTLATFTVMNDAGTVLGSTTLAANIPTTRQTGAGITRNKSVGTATRLTDVDYCLLRVE